MKLSLKKIAPSVLCLCTFAGIMFVGLKGCKNESLPSEAIRNVPNLPLLREIARHKTKLPTSYVPPEATVTITPKDPTKTLQDIVDIRTKTYGLCFKPGIQGTFPLGVGLDAKLAFYGKYGVGVVGSLQTGHEDLGRRFAAGVFVSRHLEMFDNLEPIVGIKFNLAGSKTPYVGMRLSF